ncbi:MAG TPA: glycosyltransferase [Longimicrobium sp.]|jgi:GT2 family glycosyltransferase
MTVPPLPAARPVTVGVATRDRVDSLARCLASLRAHEPLVAEAIVVDDGSAEPVEPRLRAVLGDDAPRPLRFIRHEASLSLAASRNRIAREAKTPWVLNLDDDAHLLPGDGVRRAVAVLEGDPEVAAVAFAQAGASGEPWPAEVQPARVDYPCYVPTFIGFGHLLRREAFLAAGGFREQLGIHGEEKELALRLLDAGWRIVYLPDARVAHLADAAGRDRRRYLHLTVRNDVLNGLYNEPFPLVVAGLAARLRRYFPIREGWNVDDPGGFRRLLAALARDLPGAWRQRRPVRWSTLARWRRMTRSAPEPYRGPSPAAGG